MQDSSENLITIPKQWDLRRELRTSKGAGAQVEMTFELQDACYRIPGLVTDGSLNGCGIVAVTDIAIHQGDVCSLMMGGYGPIHARVKWLKDLDKGILKLGMQYLDSGLA